MSLFGLYFVARGAYDKAEQWLCRAIEIDEAAWGDEPTQEWFCLFGHPSVPSLYARHLGNYATLLEKTSQFTEATGRLQFAINLLKHHSPDDPIVAALTHDLGAVLMKAGHSLRAEELLREALQIDEVRCKAFDQDVARDLNTLGKLLLELNRFDEAELALRRAVRIDSKWRNCVPRNRVIGTDWLDSPRPVDKSWLLAAAYERKITFMRPKWLGRNYGRYIPALARDIRTLARLRAGQGREDEGVATGEISCHLLVLIWAESSRYRKDVE
jgi:tetratricopeptide (TPR) repeat protein